jgi:hypothetical protein
MVVKKLPGPWLALGLAAHFVARHEPFSRFPAADLVRTLSGQAQRGHYLFALDVSAAPARVLGYFGWALYDDAEAERFATTGVAPSEGRVDGGTVLWVMTAAAIDRKAFFTLVKATRALYPAHRVMAVRNKARGRKVTFDQSRARVRARTAPP